MDKSLKHTTSLWLLGLSPLVWSHHFLLTYIIASVWCAKVSERGGSLGQARSAIGVVTVVAVIIILVEIYRSYQKHKLGDSNPPHDQPTPMDRERFLGFARLLISILSLLAVIYTAYVAWFFRSCL